LSPKWTGDPIAKLYIVAMWMNTDTAYWRRIAGTSDEEPRKSWFNGQLRKFPGIFFAIGPWRPRKIAHHAFISDTAVDSLPIFGPCRPQEQPIGAMKHRPSPSHPANALYRDCATFLWRCSAGTPI
jgi:hypothetical protein